ncbi:MAG TPA: hypothetical protein VGO90_08995 [Chthoniobacteraceae bacterium]|nr:hypothetical protein [Chthoniobacteraceae bacterium]
MSDAVNVCRLGRVIALLAVLICSGCSSFEKQWKEAGRTPPQNAFSGRWEGRWTSASHRTPSGKPMGGELRCLFTPQDETHYRALFKAQWLVFSSSYATIFNVSRRGEELHFEGTQDLGALYGGIYRYAGKVNAKRFEATYDSSYDRGTFRMKRPGTSPASLPPRRGD